MMARKIDEIRIPVDRLQHMTAAAYEPDPCTSVEYFVLERWSDRTIRHPTTGRMVVEELYHQEPVMWRRWLRGLED